MAISSLSWQYVHADETAAAKEKFPRNFDEDKAPPYQLPELLVAKDGTKIDRPELWETKRRPEILKMLETNLFGRPPGEIGGFDSKLISSERDGTMLIQQVVLSLKKGQRSLDIDLLMYLPADARGPVPTIIAMNFKGNHTVTDHAFIKAKNARSELVGQTSSPDRLEPRGSRSSHFPVDEIVSRG